MLTQFRLADRADDAGRRRCRTASSNGWRSRWRWRCKPKLLLLDEPTGGMSLGGAAGHRRTARSRSRQHCSLDHRRARPRFHPRHLRPADRARPGQGAGHRATVATIQRQHKVQEVYLTPCLTSRSSGGRGISTPATAAARSCSTSRSAFRRRGARRRARPQRRRQDDADEDASFGELPPMAGDDPLRRRATCSAQRDRAARAARHRLRAAGACDLRPALGAREPRCWAAFASRDRSGIDHVLDFFPKLGAAPRPDRRHAVRRRAQDAGDRPRRARPTRSC